MNRNRSEFNAHAGLVAARAVRAGVVPAVRVVAVVSSVETVARNAARITAGALSLAAVVSLFI